MRKCRVFASGRFENRTSLANFNFNWRRLKKIAAVYVFEIDDLRAAPQAPNASCGLCQPFAPRPTRELHACACASRQAFNLHIPSSTLACAKIWHRLKASAPGQPAVRAKLKALSLKQRARLKGAL
jgi:hypothetical protein